MLGVGIWSEPWKLTSFQPCKQQVAGSNTRALFLLLVILARLSGAYQVVGQDDDNVGSLLLSASH